MKNDLISVVVPVFNAAPFLSAALDSLAAQSYPDFEVILVDDGSTDRSRSICLDFTRRDARFTLVSQSNGGVSSARNRGIELAAGEWIAFMDADDLMAPEGLRILVEAARASSAGIVVGDYGRNLSFPSYSSAPRSRTVASDEAISIGLYQKRILNNPWGVLFHRSVFKGKAPLRFRRCRYEDLDLFYQAFERVEKVCLVDAVVYCYRDTPGSFINTWSHARLDVLDVTDRMYAHFAARGDSMLLRAAADRRFSAHFNMLVEMLRRGEGETAALRKCWLVIKAERRDELSDPNVRLKNKLGAMVSYLGLPAIRLLCRF